MIKKVRKRDGSLQDFSREKIATSIYKSAVEVGGTDRKLAERLADEAVELLKEKCVASMVSTKDVGDMVEKTLVEHGHYRTAKAYITYRRQQEERRRAKLTVLEVESTVDDYLGLRDWRSRENANVDVSIGGLEHYLATAVIADYTLSKIYPMEIADAHTNGDYHIHDLGRGITGYCLGLSLQQLLVEGLNGIPGKISSKPARHLDTALIQMVNQVGAFSNEWAGAVAYNSVDTLLAPFVRKDRLGYREVKQAIQSFVFDLNSTSRFGGQPPFTNLTFDLTVPKDLAEKPSVTGGKPGEPYGDFEAEAKLINRAFLEVLSEGDADGRPMSFPIPTYSLTHDFEWDNEISDLLFKVTAKYGLPYFQNFINSNLKPSDVRALCCRLSLDLRELKNKMTGGLFASADSTGSQGVVTVNMPRLGYLSKDENKFFERLDYVMELAKRSLEIKRGMVEKNIRNGLLPYTKRYLGSLRNHFSTIGLVGMNEACLNLFGCGIADGEGKRFAVRVLKRMRERIAEFQVQTGNLYNLEATPAEGTSYRLAMIDKRKYPDIITAGEREVFYSNSSQLPVNHGLSLVEALRHQEELQPLYSGGTVFHIFLGESYPSHEGCRTLFRKITTGTKLPYFTLTPTYSICLDHGYVAGKHFRCPRCGRPAEVYSRVVGYFKPVTNWNRGKREEFRQRTTFEKKLAEVRI